MLTAEKIKEITAIDCTGKGIKSLKGIEFFTELVFLYCPLNDLSSLDVSHNPELRFFNCNINQLSSLDVSNNTNLMELFCSSNQLSNLDISSNPQLTLLSCDSNKLSDLSVSNNPELDYLSCNHNKLSSLDVSHNPKLRRLSCGGNRLGCLDLSKNLCLEKVDDFLSKIHIADTQIDMIQYDNKFESGKASGFQNLKLDGNVFTVIDDQEGTYVYDCGNDTTMKVTIVANSKEPIEPTVPLQPGDVFDDVPKQPGNWKYESTKFVKERGIMGGVGGTNQFQSDNTLTRAMFATVLYRMAGEENVTFEDKFTDVEDGKWYSSAIIWANQNAIVNGYSDGTYGINDNITREQIAKMLYEYAKTIGYDISQTKELDEFTDKDSVSGWATNYMKWATAVGMISGKPNGDGSYRLDPKGEATRAECAAMIMRFEKKYNS